MLELLNKKKAINIIKAFTFFTSIALFFWLANPMNLYTFLVNQDIRLILDSILFLALSHILYAFRWVLIIKLGSKSSNTFKPFINYLVALFYNSFTPANMGGDVYRFYADSSKINDKSYILGLLIFERLIGLIIFLGFSTIVFSNIFKFFINEPDSNFFLLLGLMLIIFAFLLILFRRSIVKLVKSIGFINESFSIVRKSFLNGKLTMVSLIVSFIGVLLCVLSFDLLIKANEMIIPFWTLFGIFCAIELIRALPISYQGFGFREGFFAFCAVSFGSWSLEDAIYIAGFYYILVSFALAMTGFTAFLIKNIITYFYTGDTS